MKRSRERHKKKFRRPHSNSLNFNEKTKIENNKDIEATNENKTFKILDIRSASETAKKKLAEALDKKANSVVSVSKEENIWSAIIEIVDEEYLPGKDLQSMSDIIGIYEVKLSNSGELLSWTKKSSRKRGSVSS